MITRRSTDIPVFIVAGCIVIALVLFVAFDIPKIIDSYIGSNISNGDDSVMDSGKETDILESSSGIDVCINAEDDTPLPHSIFIDNQCVPLLVLSGEKFAELYNPDNPLDKEGLAQLRKLAEDIDTPLDMITLALGAFKSSEGEWSSITAYHAPGAGEALLRATKMWMDESGMTDKFSLFRDGDVVWIAEPAFIDQVAAAIHAPENDMPRGYRN